MFCVFLDVNDLYHSWKQISSKCFINIYPKRSEHIILLRIRSNSMLNECCFKACFNDLSNCRWFGIIFSSSLPYIPLKTKQVARIWFRPENRIRGSAPRTKGDFLNSSEWVSWLHSLLVSYSGCRTIRWCASVRKPAQIR